MILVVINAISGLFWITYGVLSDGANYPSLAAGVYAVGFALALYEVRLLRGDRL